MAELFYLVSFILVVVFLVAWIIAKNFASSLRAELAVILDGIITTDQVGSLHAYQSHYAAGEKPDLPYYLGTAVAEAPLMERMLPATAFLGPQLAFQIVSVNSMLAQVRRSLRDLYLDFCPNESVADALAENIRLCRTIELKGAKLVKDLGRFGSLSPFQYLLVATGMGKFDV
ncbi:MAG: hypothetical protein QM744_14100 [Mesorhizobium sp.]